MLRTINLRQIYCKIYNSENWFENCEWICYCVRPSFLSAIASFFIIFMTICGFHHDFRQMVPSTITKICQNVAQSALRRNQFWIVFKAICPLLLSNSCLSSNLFRQRLLFLKIATRTQLYTQNVFYFVSKFMKISTNKMQISLNNGSEATWKIGFETHTQMASLFYKIFLNIFCKILIRWECVAINRYNIDHEWTRFANWN